MECCIDGCSSGRFYHLHKGTLELCQCDQRVLGHLPDQGPSPPITQFGCAASSRKSLGGSKLVPLKNDGGHCVLGDLQCFGTLPQICALTHSCLGALWTRLHGLVNDQWKQDSPELNFESQSKGSEYLCK